MANPEKGEVGVTVGGKAYTLRPTFDSLAELEGLIGKHDNLMQVFNQGLFAGTRAVVWCLLNDEHADEIKTLKDASKWIERAGGLEVVEPWIRQAMGLNQPPEEETTATTADPLQAQAGIGEPSSSELVGSV
jgi:hypothetical protein